MADITLTLTIKDLTTNLADYDRMTQALQAIPNDGNGDPQFTVAQWRTRWLPHFIRRNMSRFKESVDKTAIVPRVVPDNDVTSR